MIQVSIRINRKDLNFDTWIICHTSISPALSHPRMLDNLRAQLFGAHSSQSPNIIIVINFTYMYTSLYEGFLQ